MQPPSLEGMKAAIRANDRVCYITAVEMVEVFAHLGKGFSGDEITKVVESKLEEFLRIVQEESFKHIKKQGTGTIAANAEKG